MYLLCTLTPHFHKINITDLCMYSTFPLFFERSNTILCYAMPLITDHEMQL